MKILSAILELLHTDRNVERCKKNKLATFYIFFVANSNKKKGLLTEGIKSPG